MFREGERYVVQDRDRNRKRKRCCSREREKERERRESTDSEISNGLFVWFGGGIFFLLSAAEAAKEAEGARNESEQHKAAFYQKLGSAASEDRFELEKNFLR